MEYQELADWLRLLHTPSIGSSSARKLLTAFGLPGAVWSQSRGALCQVVSQTQATALQQEPADLAGLLQTTWNWLAADTSSRRVLTLGDALYPRSLLQTEDPPLLLYAMGLPAAWSGNWLNTATVTCMAIVGSRNPTPQGAVNGRQFAQALAQAGLTIVSGMALGVDAAAHEGALAGAAPNTLATVAVVGTGLDRVYPSRHRDLAHRIAAHGLLISEFDLGTPPLAANFPQRNRIISGLSRGTLVVEAALLSGSLITARLAAEQGREVFAIPGSIHSTLSHGCHELIKQGAKLVESAQDVMEELEWNLERPATPGATIGADQPTEFNWFVDPVAMGECAPEQVADSALLQALGYDPVGLDALQARTGLPTPELLALLMTLELQGQVVRRPGGMFQRMVLA